MKVFNTKSLAIILVLFGMFGSMAANAATTPPLGTADTFGVLSHTYNRNGSGTVITGDLGYSILTGAGSYTVSGATHIADSAFIQAGADQATLLSSLNDQPCTFTFPAGGVDLATDISHGTLGIFTPGVYCTAAYANLTIGAAGITLSGNGTYIFRTKGMLSTAPHSVVSLTNGASACDIFWTPSMGPILPYFGFNSTFIGTDIDPEGIRLQDNVTWLGRALVFGGTFSHASNDTVSVPTNCTLPPPPPPPPVKAVLHVIKHVINDNSGKDIASSFTLHVKGAGSMGLNDVVGSPAPGAEAPGSAYTLDAGTFVISEDVPTGYTQSFRGDCDSKGNIILASGDNKTCTITNDDIAPPPPPVLGTGILHVIKTVINNDGGKAVSADATIHVANGMGDVVGSPQAGVDAPGTSYTLTEGTYTVSENFFAGYTVAIGGDCIENGNVVLTAGSNKTCTIINNDIAGLIPYIPPTILVTTTLTSSTPITTTTIITTTTPPAKPLTCNICSRLVYDVYIINPNKSERHTGTPWVRVTDRGNGIKRYSFEDKTLDPNDSNYDYNDSVIDVDFTDCKNVKFMFVSSDASWKHQIKIKVSVDGVTQSDTLVTNDSKAVVGTIKVLDASTKIKLAVACPSAATLAKIEAKAKLQVRTVCRATAMTEHNIDLKNIKLIRSSGLKLAKTKDEKKKVEQSYQASLTKSQEEFKLKTAVCNAAYLKK